jgi:thiol-disulfide isomerase/thioredoxin
MIKVTMYGASWCAPCRATKPQFFKSQEDENLTSLGVDFQYVDIDEAPEQVASLGIRSVPTILLDMDGMIVPIKSRTSEKITMEIEHYVESSG